MKNNKRDLSIVYRIYPGVSKIPVIHPENKFELSKVAIRSLKDALGNLDFKLWVILDGCPEKYENLFTKIFIGHDIEFIRYKGAGNYKTYEAQIELLLDQNYSELVYLAEDDYVFLPNAFEKAIDFYRSSQDIDFLTLYDSLDYYKMEFHNYNSQTKNFSNEIWRTVSCTTGSFMTSKQILKDKRWVFETLSKKSNYDSSLWISLTKMKLFQFSSIKRYLYGQDRDLVRLLKCWIYCWKQILFGKKYNLWAPTPSLATHLDKNGIAPSIDWKEVFEKYN